MAIIVGALQDLNTVFSGQAMWSEVICRISSKPAKTKKKGSAVSTHAPTRQAALSTPSLLIKLATRLKKGHAVI